MVYPESEPKDTKYLLKVIVKRQEVYKLSEQAEVRRDHRAKSQKSLEQKIQFSQTESSTSTQEALNETLSPRSESLKNY